MPQCQILFRFHQLFTLFHFVCRELSCSLLNSTMLKTHARPYEIYVLRRYKGTQFSLLGDYIVQPLTYTVLTLVYWYNSKFHTNDTCTNWSKNHVILQKIG